MRTVNAERRVKALLQRTDYGARAEVQGWVRTRRDSKGGFSFIEVNDGSCLPNIQAVVPASLPTYEADVLRLHTGASVEIDGTLAASQGKGQSVELQATAVRVLGFADPEAYPIQKQKTSLEHLRTIAHLRPRTNTFGAVARVRSALAGTVHQFFQSRGFVWLPRGSRHGYRVEGDEPVRTLVFSIPAGFERFVIEAGEPALARTLPPPSEPDLEKLGAAAARYGQEILGPLPL